MDVETALEGIVQGNMDNASMIETNTMNVEQLQMDVEKQTVVADYI